MLQATPVDHTISIFYVCSRSNRSSAVVILRASPSECQFSADSSWAPSFAWWGGGGGGGGRGENNKNSPFLFLTLLFSQGLLGPVGIVSPCVTTEMSSLIWHAV